MSDFNLFKSREMAISVAVDAATMGDEVLGIITEGEESEHLNEPECWCNPTLIYTASNGNKVYEHHRKA